MSVIQSANKTHNDTVAKAESVRQAAVSGATQAAINTAEITFARAGLASAITNSCSTEPWMALLISLGVRA